MAKFADNIQQATNEVHTYTVDYTNDLPTGGTVTTGTAIHTPPSGSASTLSTSVVSPYVYVTVPALSVTGLHFVDVLATFNDNDKSAVRIPVVVVYANPTARAGMLDLIDELRELADVGPNEYTQGGRSYWTDAQLQKVLDRNREDFFEVELSPVGQTVAASNDDSETGTVICKRYQAPYHNIEGTASGSDIFKLTYANGGTCTQGYSFDGSLGLVEFTANQDGTAIYLTARAYDLNRAAADVWDLKASYYAKSYNVSTDNHTLSRAQLFDHCKDMARYYRTLSGPTVIAAERGDTENYAAIG